MLAGSMITSEHVHMQVGTAAMYALASWVEHTGPQIVRPQLGTLAGLLSGTAPLTLCMLLMISISTVCLWNRHVVPSRGRFPRSAGPAEGVGVERCQLLCCHVGADWYNR